MSQVMVNPGEAGGYNSRQQVVPEFREGGKERSLALSGQMQAEGALLVEE